MLLLVQPWLRSHRPDTTPSFSLCPLYLRGTQIFLPLGSPCLGLAEKPTDRAQGAPESILPAAASPPHPLGTILCPPRGQCRVPDWDGASLGTSARQARAEPGVQAPGEEACGYRASGLPIPGESRSNRTMPPKERLPLAATARRSRAAGLSRVPALGRGLRAASGGRDSPCAAARRLGRPRRIARGLAPHRAGIVTRPAAPAGTPTSGSGTCPRPAPRLRERESSWSREKGLSFPFGSWRKGLFLRSGVCPSGFQLPLEPRLLCHRVGDKRRPKKKQIETGRLGSAAIAGSGECGIRFLCLYGLTAFFSFFYYGRLLWQRRSLPRHGQSRAKPNPAASPSISSPGPWFEG